MVPHLDVSMSIEICWDFILEKYFLGFYENTRSKIEWVGQNVMTFQTIEEVFVARNYYTAHSVYSRLKNFNSSPTVKVNKEY